MSQKTVEYLGQQCRLIIPVSCAPVRDGRRNMASRFLLLIDMNRRDYAEAPYPMLDGEQWNVNAIWFDNVRVPAQNLVGD